jgi:general secretion pathway protein K
MKQWALHSCAVGTKRRSQAGIALILVVWIVALISGIALAFARSQKTEAELARNQRLIAQSRALAEAGVHRAFYELKTPSFDPNRWQARGTPLVWEVDGATVTIRALDEAARVDLNTANPELLKGLFRNAGVDEVALDALIDAIADWRDPDELKRVNGAEAEDYKSAGKRVLPSNADFVSVTELQAVLGVTPELFKSVEPYLTVNSRQTGVSIALAPREVLLAIPNITAENVDLYLTTRREAMEQKLPIPPLPGAGGAFFAGGSNVYRVQVEVTTENGFKNGREAIFRMPFNNRDSFDILGWKDLITPMAGPLDGAPGGAEVSNDGAPR